MKSTLMLTWLFMGLCCMCGMCAKEPQPFNDDTSFVPNQTPAEKVAGSFTGTGKYLPRGIGLGTKTGCVTITGWENHLKSGTSGADIAKLTDSTIKVTITSSSFQSVALFPLKVTTTGNIVSFPGGSYNPATKFFTLSLLIDPGFSPECSIGLPYYYGQKIFFTNDYVYKTLEHIEFSGMKQ